MAYLPKKIKKGDPITAADLNAMQDELKRLGTVRVSGMSMHDGPGGYAFGVTFPAVAKVAKVGGTAIPAMSTLTPGSGDVTLYDMGATALVAQSSTVTAYNIHLTETVTANAWIMVVEIDGKWLVTFEACA